MGKLKSYSRHHPRAGQKVIIKNGPLKGIPFQIIDYLTTMHQGKDIKRIKADQFTTPIKNRGLPLDEDVVFGQFYPTMQHGCVHDSELKVKLEEVKGNEAKAELPPNVEPLKKKRKKNENQTPAE